jgi:hypothetical protein
MLPGNMGTGTAMDAQVNRRKKAKKIAPALIYIHYTSFARFSFLTKHCKSLVQVKHPSGIAASLERVFKYPNR